MHVHVYEVKTSNTLVLITLPHSPTHSKPVSIVLASSVQKDGIFVYRQKIVIYSASLMIVSQTFHIQTIVFKISPVLFNSYFITIINIHMMHSNLYNQTLTICGH